MTHHEAIHQKAAQCARNFQRDEALLLEALIEVRRHRVYRTLGYPSLFEYGVNALKLPEAQVYNFTRVAEKSQSLPLVHQAIKQGVLNVSKTRRILSVVTPETQTEWIEKAATLKQRALEEAIVKEKPEAALPERLKPLSETRVALVMTLSKDEEKALRRIQDLESQRQKKSVTLEETLAAMMETYLEKNAPERKAQRARKLAPRQVSSSRTKPSGRAPIPAAIKHQVTLRDQSRCTATQPDGQRCTQQRWLETHHLVHVSQGGANSLPNLTTLCHFHHRQEHALPERF